MLRVLLLVAPQPQQSGALAAALAATPLSEVYAHPAMTDAATVLAAPHTLAPTSDGRLEAGASAIELVQSVAEGNEGTIALVADARVVREVLVYALDAPVAEDRLPLDPGTIAEVEVRLDAPWTVNRINDGCHLRPLDER